MNRSQTLDENMPTICEKHFQVLTKAVKPSNYENIPYISSIYLMSYVDGEKFGYDIYKLYEDIKMQSDSCPFCYVKDEAYINKVIRMCNEIEPMRELKNGDFNEQSD